MSIDTEKLHYIGDGLYVRLDGGYQIQLSSHNGLHVLATVYLEPKVWLSLLQWIRLCGLQGHFPIGGQDRER